MSNFRFIFDLNDYTEYLDLSRFQFYHAAISGFTLAIATDRHLILSDGVSDGLNQQEATIRVVLEFNEDSIRSTAIAWITDEIIAVGFESGFVVCFNCLGEEIFEYRGNKSSVQSIRYSSADVNGKGPGVWILYELGYLISIPLSQVLRGKSDFFVAFKFAEHVAINDFVFCPTIYAPSIFDLDDGNNNASHSILVSGMNSALSLYNLGGKLHFQDFDKLTGYAKGEKVSSMLSKSFMSLFSSLTSSSSATATSAIDAAKARYDRSEDPLKVEEKAITLTSMLDLQDVKRRILRLSMEPFGSLVAAADSLGRVTLYDTRTNCIVRLWKGLRDARLAWTHSLEADSAQEECGSSSRSNSQSSTTKSADELLNQSGAEGAREVTRLHLVVYAPQLGLVSVYRMPQGACLRIVPVGLNGQLCTIMDETAGGLRVAKSFLMRSMAASADGNGDGGEGCSVEMIEVDPVQYSESDIDVHSASAIALLGGGEADGQADDLMLSDEEEETGERSVGRKAVELRLLQKLEKAFAHLAEGHGSVARATAAASAQNVEISGRAVDEGLVLAAEQRVWDLLNEVTSSSSSSKRHQLSLRGVLRVMGIVESLELRGSSDWSPTVPTATAVVSSIHGRSPAISGAADCGRGICFSAQFHGKLSSLLNDVLNSPVLSAEEEEGDASVGEVVAVEVRLRGRLLTAYEQLLDIQASFEQSVNPYRDTLGGASSSSSSTFSSPLAAGSQVSPMGQQADETAVICRGNTSRAEALCWALRATKKAERTAARLRIRRQTEDKHLQAHSPKVLRPVGPLTAMHSLSPAGASLGSGTAIGLTSPGGKGGRSVHAVRRPLLGTHSSPLNQQVASMGSPRSSDPHVGGQVASSSSSQAVLFGGRPLFSGTGAVSFDCNSVSFSAFRALHKQYFGSVVTAEGAAVERDGALDAETFSAARLNSEDLLAFVAAADSYFRPARKTKVITATVDAVLHQPPQMRKNVALQSFLKDAVSLSSSNSPSLAAVKNRKFFSSLAPASLIERTDQFRLCVESVFCADLLGPSRPLLGATTAVQVGAAVSIPWAPPSMSAAYSLLQLVAAPLQGDLFAMGAFSAATRLMGASGPEGITRLLPLHLAYLAHQPVCVLVSEVLTKKLSTSPLQRWLRDTLLTFQDSVAAYGPTAFDKLLSARHIGSSRSGSVEGVGRGDDQSQPAQSEGNNLISDLNAEGEEEEEEEAVEEAGPVDGSLSRGSSFSGGGGGEEAEQLLALTVEVLRHRRAATREPLGEEKEEEDLLPSYDEFVRHILRPVWIYARDCSNLEAVLAFAAIVLETVQTVHEQVERRTYGASGLSLTIAAWENLVRQVRVALLLSSRVGLERDATEMTVERLGSGRVSLHRLLAADTLCFAVRADQAVEHEERCQEVFNRRSGGGSSESTDSTARSDVLLAWGRVADKRWRDLIAVAVAEDAIEGGGDGGAVEKEKDKENEEGEEDGTPQKKRAAPVRRRRPLLLYFPRHSQQRFLGGYRALILAERWALKAHHVDGLALVSEHLFSLPSNWRGAVAAEVYSTHVLPLVQAFLALEEDTFSSQPQIDMAPLAREAGGVSEGSNHKTQLLTILGDIALLKTFVRSAVEILRFVEICVLSAARESPDAHKTSNNPVQGKAHPVEPYYEADSSRDGADCFAQEVNESVWPGTSDRYMGQLYARFYWSVSAEGDSSALALVREVVAPKWSADLLQAHISVLWVLLLRFQCGLRGIRPSKVLGTHATRSLQALDETHNAQPYCRGYEENALEAASIRLEFLNQCLRRLIAVDPPVAVYRVAELWALDLDVVRLLHITALLERSGALDDEVDLLVPQVRDGGAVVDVVTAALRNRLGGVVARIDRLAVFGPLLAAMDAEAVSWARKALPGDFTPDSAALEDIARGRARAVNINLASTRHLVISMQGVLLAVPVTERYGNPGANGAIGGAAGGVSSSWLERKGKCDALLSLCNSFSHLSGGKTAKS